MLKILIMTIMLTLTLNLHLQIQVPQTQKYYANLGAENYIFGSDLGQQFYFSQLIYSPNISKCPFNSPFTVDGNSCFQCPL